MPRTKEEIAQYQKQYQAENRDRLREHSRDWWTQNREVQLVKKAAYRETHRQELRDKQRDRHRANPEVHQTWVRGRNRSWIKWCRDWKAIVGCVTCGERNPVCLDFHHLDPATKKDNVGALGGCGDQKRLDEIVKCVVVCANCHRKAHALEKEEENDES